MQTDGNNSRRSTRHGNQEPGKCLLLTCHRHRATCAMQYELRRPASLPEPMIDPRCRLMGVGTFPAISPAIAVIDILFDALL